MLSISSAAFCELASAASLSAVPLLAYGGPGSIAASWPAAIAGYQQSEDLIQLGAYASGSNPRLDASIRVRDGLMNFLRQHAHVSAPREETLERLNALAASLA